MFSVFRSKVMAAFMVGGFCFSLHLSASEPTVLPYCKNQGHFSAAEIQKKFDIRKSFYTPPRRGAQYRDAEGYLQKAYFEGDVVSMRHYIDQFVHSATKYGLKGYGDEYIDPFLAADYLDDLQALEAIYTFFKAHPDSIRRLRKGAHLHSTLYNTLVMIPYLKAKVGLLKGDVESFKGGLATLEVQRWFIGGMLRKGDNNTDVTSLDAYLDEYARISFMYIQLLIAGKKYGYLRDEKWPFFLFDLIHDRVNATCSNRLKAFAAIMRDAPESSVETVTQKIKQDIPDVPILALMAEKWMRVLEK